MPYKEPRHQINLKLTDAEYAPLAQEAALARSTVALYARHLIVQRTAQPLSIAAQRLKERYEVREEALQDKIGRLQQRVNTLVLQNADIPLLQQQIQEARHLNAQLSNPEAMRALIEEVIQRREKSA
ncbi:hypothetical protein GCM10022408_37940 [Hymenobacter fastidiosus]|uniref:Uncharacterized protein n=2 Tax=Hymenobacter fastidiosus TaxID=486264 RepID=A0ABP7T3W6_9BACT